jgi:hypothetical protein
VPGHHIPRVEEIGRGYLLDGDDVWGSPTIWAAIAAGVILLVVFFAVQARTGSPLINVAIFRNQRFTVENIIIRLAMMALIPVFFFAALHGQIALAEQAITASLLILYFFVGFVVCAQIGGRMLDRTGAKQPVVLGSALAAVRFGLWASRVTGLGCRRLHDHQPRAGAPPSRFPVPRGAASTRHH